MKIELFLRISPDAEEAKTPNDIYLLMAMMDRFQAEKVAEILQHIIDGRNQHQGDGRGEEDAEGEADCHRDQELGLGAGLRDHRGQAEKSG